MNLFVLVVLASCYSAQKIEEAALRTLRSEGLVSWRNMQRAAVTIEINGSQTIETRFRDAGDKIAVDKRAFDFELLRRPEKDRQLEIRHRKPAAGEVARVNILGCNERYGFELLQRGVNKFELRSLNQGASKSSIERQPRFEFKFALESSFCCCHRPLFDVLDNSEFELVELREVSSGTTSLLVASFNYLGEQWGHGYYPKGRYTCQIDPANFFAVVRSEVVFPSRTKPGKTMVHSWENTFQSNAEGVPIVKSSRLRRHVLGDTLGDDILTAFGSPREPTRGEEEFYLPFYGIPETVLKVVEPKRNYMRYVLIVVGALGIVVALWWGFGRRSG